MPVEIEKARARGVRTLLDSSGDGFRYGIEAGPDFVKPNRAELSQWAKQPLDSLDDVVHAAKKIVNKGVPTIIVSLGNEGLLAVTKATCHHVFVPAVEAISTVGAGNTVVAGLFYGIYHQYSLTDVISFAAAAGTAAISTPGTQQPQLADVRHSFHNLSQTVRAVTTARAVPSIDGRAYA